MNRSRKEPSMNLVAEHSLYQIVTNAAMFFFDGGTFTSTQQARLADWILARQNRRQGFIFYPTASDLKAGVTLFSGEKPKTKLLANNAVELEILRLLALIQPKLPSDRPVLHTADERLARLCFSDVCTTGECAHASIAFLRYVTASGPDGSASKINHAVKRLKQNRDGAGKWRKFPFFFTFLWLTELPNEIAQDEFVYTKEICGRLLARYECPRTRTDRVRMKTLQRVLAKTSRG
jgi:hypothetical protein